MTFQMFDTNPDAQCPYCRKPLDRASGNAVPKPGDLSVCVYCGAGLVFLVDFKVRMMTWTDLQECDAQTRTALEEAVKLAGFARLMLQSRN